MTTQEDRDRLVRLETDLEYVKAERGELRQAIDELTAEVRQQFEGHDGGPGIITRIVVLEQAERRRAKWTWLAFSAAVFAFFASIGERIFGKH